jgi:hypothetical protein
MLDAIIDAAATHRLTKLVIDDFITEPLREKVFEKFGDPSESKVSYLITCPWCVSFWAGAGVVAARTLAPKAWRPLAYALAFSSATGWVEEHS